MAIKKNTKDTLTAAEIKEIKKQLEELKADAEKREIAKGLRDDGVPMEIIVRRTGFTESEIRSF